MIRLDPEVERHLADLGYSPEEDRIDIPRPRLIVGIDPGLDGAMVVLTAHGPAWRGTFVTRDATLAKPSKGRTYDYRLMRRTLEALYDGASTVVIETPQAFSKAPRGASISTGFGVGLWLGLVVGLRPGWSILMVAPNVWHRALFGKGVTGDPKARAATFAMANLPSLDPRCGGRFRKAHQGVLDAACLAMYGLIQTGKPR